MKLINAVFKELEALKDSNYKFDIVKLKSIYYSLKVNNVSFYFFFNSIKFQSILFYFEQKDFSNAIKCISKYVHEYPMDTKGWIELCLCLKRNKKYDIALKIGNVLFKTSNIQANPVY